MNGYGHFLAPQLWFKAYWGCSSWRLLLLASRAVGAGRRRRGEAASVAGQAAIARRPRRGARRQRGRRSWRSADSCSGTPTSATTTSRPMRSSTCRRVTSVTSASTRTCRSRRCWPSAPTSTCTRKRSRCACTAFTACTTPTRQPIADVHVQVIGRQDPGRDRHGRRRSWSPHDEPLGYRIYHLDRPLQPGEQRDIAFDVDFHPTGIQQRTGAAPDRRQRHLLQQPDVPGVRLRGAGQITDRNERRKRGLGEPTRMHKLEDQAARAEQLPHRRCGLDRFQGHRLHRAGPDRAVARLPAEGVHPRRPSLLQLRDGPADAGLLFVPVGALAGEEGRRTRHSDRGLLRPEASVQRRPHDPGHAEVAGVLRGQLHARTSTSRCASSSSPATSSSRRVSPTPSRTRNRSASSPTCATRMRSTTSSTSPRTRSHTSGGRTR